MLAPADAMRVNAIAWNGAKDAEAVVEVEVKAGAKMSAEAKAGAAAAAGGKFLANT